MRGPDYGPTLERSEHLLPDTVDFDALRTIADISVALAGFIGIILVLQHRDVAFMSLGMTTIFGASFGAMMFSLIPDLLSGLLSTETM